MNARKITGVVLAVALIALMADTAIAGQPGPVGPYGDAVMTAAPNAGIARIGGDSVVAMDDTMSSARNAENSAAALAKFSWCSTLTFSSNGHDTAMSSNQFADPFLSADTSFVCHTY